MSKSEQVEAYWEMFAWTNGVTEANYVAFAFGDNPAQANRLLALILGGDKRATAGLARYYGADEPLPKAGDYAVVLDGVGAPACIIRTTEVEVKALSAADANFAWDEGEGDRSLAWWMDAHVQFFQRAANAEGFAFSDDVETMFERFDLAWPSCPAAVRVEAPTDVAAVRALTTEAFATSEVGDKGEADIVDAIRSEHPRDILSLVAEHGDDVIGHVLFSPVTLGESTGMGLAPMAVAPEHQGKRVGAELVRCGLRILRESGCPFVIVLGHPLYYPRFGFRPAAAHGILSEFDGVPEDAFLILSLDGAPLQPGTARYVSALRPS